MFIRTMKHRRGIKSAGMGRLSFKKVVTKMTFDKGMKRVRGGVTWIFFVLFFLKEPV